MSQARNFGAVLAFAVVYIRMEVPVKAWIRIRVRLEASPRDFLLLSERGVGSRVGSSFPFVVFEKSV